jgi:hypothetical protein
VAKELSPGVVAARAAKFKEAQDFAEALLGPLGAALLIDRPTNRRIAAVLNRQGLRTRTNERWTSASIRRLRIRLGIARLNPVEGESDPVAVAGKLSPNQFAESLRPVIEEARVQGATSHHAVADYLTERGIRTARGRRIWDHDGARRLLARLKAIDAGIR